MANLLWDPWKPWYPQGFYIYDTNHKIWLLSFGLVEKRLADVLEVAGLEHLCWDSNLHPPHYIQEVFTTLSVNNISNIFGTF